MEFDVVSLPTTDHPTSGDTAPTFTRPLVNREYWEDTSLTELLEGGPVTLLFHPMDGAFPTLYIWNEVTDREWTDHCHVIGVSASTPYEHMEFLRDRGLENYRLFSDPSADIAELYGVGHDLDDMTGVTEHRPAVFVIDTDRTVTYDWVAAEWPAFPEYDALEDAIMDL